MEVFMAGGARLPLSTEDVFSWQGVICTTSQPQYLSKCQYSLPKGGLISGGGIMGTMMGMLPCSLVPGMEVEGSVTPFLEPGRQWELLAPSGEPSPLSVEAGIFGNKFSRQGEIEQNNIALLNNWWDAVQ